ncbi:Hypothetical predicted protein [Octopus vulgaris]|uniref:Uncharacterized protein n=1 Tax=Octopus vulgaris TaxID=6645 RepID=A0AA36ARK8_OCTVU|nr:Hypothetical predicted protein [Octopus vulgaris]
MEKLFPRVDSEIFSSNGWESRMTDGNDRMMALSKEERIPDRMMDLSKEERIEYKPVLNCTIRTEKGRITDTKANV